MKIFSLIMKDDQFSLLKLRVLRAVALVLAIAMIPAGCSSGKGSDGHQHIRIQDQDLGRQFPVRSTLQGRDAMFEALVDEERIDDRSSISFVLLDLQAEHSEQVLRVFCYHKPGNCGQDEEANSLYSAKDAQQYITHTVLPGDNNRVKHADLRDAYSNITNPQNSVAIIPFAPSVETVVDRAFAIFSAANTESISLGAPVLASDPSVSNFVNTDIDLIQILLQNFPSNLENSGNSERPYTRRIAFNDDTFQDIPIFFMVAGYVVDDNDRIIPSSGSVSCQDMVNFCIRAPFEATLLSENRNNDEILSTTLPGNSFAAPSVAAVLYSASQLWAHLERDEVIALLVSCLEDLGDPGIDETWGLGIPDLECMSRPQGMSLAVNGRSIQGLPKGTPLSGSSVTLSLFEVRFRRTFTGHFMGTQEDIRIPGFTFAPLLEENDVLPPTLFTQERVQVIPAFSGLSLGASFTLQPIVAVPEKKARPIIGIGFFRSLEQSDTVLAWTYHHPERFFGLHKGTHSFDPGKLQEIGLVFHYRHQVNPQFTVQIKGNCSQVWAEGKNLVDELRGFGCHADTGLSWRPYDVIAFHLGLQYQNILNMDYTVAQQSVEVDDTEKLMLGLHLDVTF